MKVQSNRLLLLSLLIGFLIAPCQLAQAQRRGSLPVNLPHYDFRPYNFGFVLGVNQMNFALRTVGTDSLHTLNGQIQHPEGNLLGVLTRPELGFHIGIVSTLRLADMFDLRFIPTLSFGERFLEYRFSRGSTVLQPLEATFIEFPLQLKYKSHRMQNTRAYVLTGLKFSTDLSSNQFKDEADGELIFARTRQNDWHFEIGTGLDHYFYFFKFSIEIKASFGLRALQLPGEQGQIFTDPIARLNARNIMISFIFE